MPTYLVERYLPGRDRAWLEEALERLPRDNADVTYPRLDLRPVRRIVLLPVQRAGAENVRRVNEVAGVPFARIVAVVELAVAAEERPR